MVKLIKSLLLILLMFAVHGLSYGANEATLGNKGSSGNYRFVVNSSGNLLPGDNDTYDIGSSAKQLNAIYAKSATFSSLYRSVKLPITEFTIFNILNSNAILPLSASSVPKLAINNLIPSLVWVDNAQTPAQVTFKVPDDYLSGGYFRVFAHESGTMSPCHIDYYLNVNKSGTAWDSATNDYVTVPLTGGSTASPSFVSLPATTDMATIVSGDVVTLTMWRDNTNVSVNDLEVSYVEFYYKAKQ